MDDSRLIRLHLKSLGAQLRVIEALADQPHEARKASACSFGDLFGSLSGHEESTAAEIDSALYRVSEAIADEG